MKALLALVAAGALALPLLAVQKDPVGMPAPTPLQRLEARADSGVPAAQYALSALLERGERGVPKDTARALSLLRASARAGYAPAQNYLGYCYAVPLLGLKEDPDSALAWIERAAMAPEPDPKAFNNLGLLLLDGVGGVRQDYDKALYWLRRGAERGVPTAQATLARAYLEGLGVPADTVAARALLYDASRAGLTDASIKLAALLQAETDTLTGAEALEYALPYYHSKILPVALPLIDRAAGAGVPLAQAIMAQLYSEGIAVGYDYARALQLYQAAAEGGDPSAQFILAELLAQYPDLLSPGLPTPEELYKAAEAGGVHDAPGALRRLRP